MDHHSSTFVTGYEIDPSREEGNSHTTVVNQQTGVTTSVIEAALLQLDFPAFLRERTRAATPCGEAIGIKVPTNAIALTSLAASGNLINGRGKGRVSDSE